MQNPYSLYQLYKYPKGRIFLNNYINRELNTNEEYILLDFYNQEFNDVRSYSIFESKNNIVIIEFINDDEIYKYLKKTSNKNIYLLKPDNDIWIAKTRKEQEFFNKDITNILYKMNKYLIELYDHEEYLKSKFDK